MGDDVKDCGSCGKENCPCKDIENYHSMLDDDFCHASCCAVLPRHDRRTEDCGYDDKGTWACKNKCEDLRLPLCIPICSPRCKTDKCDCLEGECEDCSAPTGKCPCVTFLGYEKCSNTGCYEAGKAQANVPPGISEWMNAGIKWGYMPYVEEQAEKKGYKRGKYGETMKPCQHPSPCKCAEPDYASAFARGREEGLREARVNLKKRIEKCYYEDGHNDPECLCNHEDVDDVIDSLIEPEGK